VVILAAQGWVAAAFMAAELEQADWVAAAFAEVRAVVDSAVVSPAVL
jgi:hypothetical protein